MSQFSYSCQGPRICVQLKFEMRYFSNMTGCGSTGKREDRSGYQKKCVADWAKSRWRFPWIIPIAGRLSGRLIPTGVADRSPTQDISRHLSMHQIMFDKISSMLWLSYYPMASLTQHAAPNGQSKICLNQNHCSLAEILRTFGTIRESVHYIKSSSLIFC